MFKISITEGKDERRLVLEGTLVAPWADELEHAWQAARTQQDHRRLVIDLSDVTQISPEGEHALTRLLQEGAKVACCGVFNRHLLKLLTRRCGVKR